jgi:hypothetical protein
MGTQKMKWNSHAQRRYKSRIQREHESTGALWRRVSKAMLTRLQKGREQEREFYSQIRAREEHCCFHKGFQSRASSNRAGCFSNVNKTQAVGGPLPHKRKAKTKTRRKARNSCSLAVRNLQEHHRHKHTMRTQHENA